MFETPVLFIVFNRAETTQQVFNVIRRIQPKHLFISADGPRKDNPEDIEKCRNVRAIIADQIDWECDLKTLYREQNSGCGIAPSRAISWFFEQVDEGIIIEDDCLPHPDFFLFCSELLAKYRNNPMVLSIAGSNFQDGIKRGNASYYFSVYNRIWGWATWKRTWENYDYFLGNIDKNESKIIVKSLFRLFSERMYWLKVYKCSKENQINNSAWDFQFMFLQWKLGGFTITPNTNLISNIGYGEDATHTAWGENDLNLNRSVEAIFPIDHPDKIERNRKADEYYFLKFIKPKSNYRNRIIRKTRKILNSILIRSLSKIHSE